MENKKIEKDLGKELKLIGEYIDGQIKLEIVHAGSIGGAGAYVVADAYAIVDAVTDLIPGNWDDAVLDPLAKKFLSKEG